MLELNETSEILIYTRPVDMRKSFNGLIELTKNKLEENPQSKKIFVFRGKSKRIVKLLIWDRTGYMIVAKKLEVGSFKIYMEEEKKPINKGQLLQFFDGLTLGIKQKKCYK